jgi:hypothetical protein
MEIVKKAFSKFDINIENGQLSHEGREVALSSLFKIKISSGRKIPKNEESLSAIFKGLGFSINRAGNITYKRKFFNMDIIRKILKNVPLEKREKIHIDYPFYEGRLGMRTYFVNDFNQESSAIDEIMYEITERVNHALRSDLTLEADVNITLTFKDGLIHSSKKFNSFLIKDLDSFKRNLINYVDLTTSQNVNYTHFIDRIKIQIIRENSGGCNTSGNDKITVECGVKTIAPKRSSNNNCLFDCLKQLDVIDEQIYGNFNKANHNKVRKEFRIEPNKTIPITTALKIFKKYRNAKSIPLEIVNMETKKSSFSNRNVEKTTRNTISLENGHYTIKSSYPLLKCDNCLQTYRTVHNCNLNRASYAHAKIKKSGRILLSHQFKAEENNKDDIIHYDLESVPMPLNYFPTENLSSESKIEIHNYYIAGFNDGNDFRTFEGVDCIKKFVDYLLIRSDKRVDEAKERLRYNEQYTMAETSYNNMKLSQKERMKKKVIIDKLLKAEIKPLYVNAFNGANFDHYAIYNEFIKRNIKPDKSIINNGAIIKFEYKNLILFDICKHLTGGLSANLKSFKCNIVKGDFDHTDKRLKKGWEYMPDELKNDCLKYLHADVMGLKELYEKLNNTIHTNHGINITKYISTSSLTFNLWKEHYMNSQECNVAEKEQKSIDFINLPTLEQEQAFRQSVRGGRTYKSKHSFTSEQYSQFLDGTKNFDDINDYLIDADVVSLYPTAMAKYKFPVGECKKLLEGEHEMKGEMGVYLINFTTNKNLQHSIGGRRGDDGSLKWDLKDGSGYYTSVDIEDMNANGYEVEIVSGYYWMKTGYIFKEFIEKLFVEKQNSEKGSVQYALAKLFMNALYGKMIQRPIYNKTKTISTNSEYWAFWTHHNITGVEEVGDSATSWIVYGTAKDDVKMERCITKPTHLGAFILAYSRRIMLGYMKESNPHFDSTDENKKIENDFYYTDTDSLQIHVKNAKLMKNLGNKELGGITDDLGDDSKIIRGIWIAPKLYMLEYVKKGDKSIHYHFRGKGLNTDSLNVESFEKMNSGGCLKNVREFQMKKVHIKRNSKQQDIPQFSIIHLKDIAKTVNTTKWAGRNFTENVSIPWK